MAVATFRFYEELNEFLPRARRKVSFKTPCAETGLCSDCRSPDRICRVVHVQERRPRLTDVRVLLVAESLGL